MKIHRFHSRKLYHTITENEQYHQTIAAHRNMTDHLRLVKSLPLRPNRAGRNNLNALKFIAE